ncbi:extracellular solute-binding protein [Yinghuangia seranimata]|uniref:extracellular solute-binding protein n=1 Tax=Yinghuangia seranimata TaxID=408067 RepID=UPI00248CF803|nr:extracellular solute-binding protein [Yinghuangia seranimata]MDI2128075.1 extracellular solute-binding protein [Yinghuangia seranimata]
MKRRLFVAAGVAAALAGVAACGSSDDGDKKDGQTPAAGASSNAPAPGNGKKVTVWLMKGTAPDDYLAAFKAKFEADHPGATLDVQIQQWNGIDQKIISALASKDAPDVMEAGNTQVATYAASGGVKDLTGKVNELGGKDWLTGLSNPGKVDGKQYGVPFYAANRVVIYNKEAFAAAGITAPPKTQAEWLEDTKKLNSGDQQGIYLPGQNWYFYAGLLKDQGGDLAVKDGDKWKGGLDTPAAAAAANFYKDLQANSKAAKDGDEKTQPETVAAANGKVAQFIAVPGELETVVTKNPALKDKYGYFPIPGKDAAKPGAVLTGGSDLIIPETAKNQDLAYDVIKQFNSDEWQTKLAKAIKMLPNKTTLGAALEGDAGAAAMMTGASNGFATPNSPNWTAVESNNPIKAYLTKVLTGTDAAAAGKEANETLTKTLNTKS